MTIGDKYFKDTCLRALWGYKDENPRPRYKDGTPAHTLSENHICHTYNLDKLEFPFITLRPLAVKNAIKEIFWIYQDQSNDLGLLESKYGINWWREWESKDEPGTIGQRYGATVKKYHLIDNLINDIKTDPFGRRKIMSLWQNSDLEETDGLAPCAFQTIWNVRNSQFGHKYLDMVLIQRSCDWGVAGNINGIQYCALLMMIAKATGCEPGKFTHFMANVQIYDRHVDNIQQMLSREPIECKPRLILDTNETDFYKFKPSDFRVAGYPLDEIKSKNPQLSWELGI